MTDVEYYALLSDDEKAALDRYKDDPDMLNEKLRSGEVLDEAEMEMVSHLDSAIKKYASEEELIVFRGFGSATIDDYLKNWCVIFKAYSSTTKSRKEACIFLLDAKKTEMPIFLELKIPVGCRIALMEGNSSFNNEEKEILLPRLTTIKILSKKLINNQNEILNLDGKIDLIKDGLRDGRWSTFVKGRNEVLYISGEVLLGYQQKKRFLCYNIFKLIFGRISFFIRSK